MEGLPQDDRMERRKPYGKAPALLGLRAVDLLHDLCDVPPWSEDQRWRWVNSDRFAFHGWYSMEIEIFDALAEPGLSREQAGDMLVQMSAFRTTLPFDEAEGNWLLSTYGDAFERSGQPRRPSDYTVIRNRKPEVIVSCGLRRVIDGRDLLRRWWSWRRETDEFHGQHSLDLGRETLRTMIETLSPDQNLPDNYRALRTTTPHTPHSPA
jgi:hypothetical protein